MMSVLVLLVLLGMWGFVLWPLVNLRRSRSNEIRSVARFSSALRVLSSSSVGFSRGRGSLGPGARFSSGSRQIWMPWSAAARPAPRAGGGGGGFGFAGGAAAGGAARRRRTVLASAGGFWVFSLLLVAAAGSRMAVIQVLADLTLVAAVGACAWSAEQDRRTARLARRRAHRRRVVAAVEVSSPLSHAPAEAPVMTVPLDAPSTPRRAVPTPAAPDVAEPVSAPLRAPAAARVPAARQAAPRIVPPAAPEPIELAEIDVEWDSAWEPVISEPASMVRVVDLGTAARRTRLFDDDGDVDLGGDEGLDHLVARQAAASGW